MFLKNKKISKILFIFISIGVVFTLVIGGLAVSTISSEDPPLLTASKKISKSLIMRGFDQFENIFAAEIYTSTPFDSKNFEYVDLSHRYFQTVRNDKRVASFYTKSATYNTKKYIDFSDAIGITEYLRDLFPHGRASKSFINANVLEMINVAEKGENFLCEDISKMLVQLIQAGGTQARTVGLKSTKSDHVAVEMWSNQFNKWILIDPDYNIHYTSANDVPLSVMELYVMSQDNNEIKTINRMRGNSSNTLHDDDTRLLESLYKNGFSIWFYNRRVDKNLPRRHPARSPSIMGFYVGKSELEKFYHKHGSHILDDKIKTMLYKNPSKYQT